MGKFDSLTILKKAKERLLTFAQDAMPEFLRTRIITRSIFRIDFFICCTPGTPLAGESSGYRRVNLSGFPYYVAFVLREEKILVAAVGHGSRHPDYRKKRIR